ASVWWGIFLIYANLIVTLQDAYTIWQQLSFGLLISGVIFILLGVFRLTSYLMHLFTPLVTGVYMILLVGQLSGPFIKGMLGIGYFDDFIHIKITMVSILILLLSYILSRSHVAWISRYSVLISLIIGWATFKLLNLTKPLNIKAKDIPYIPEIFPFGVPQFDMGVLLTVIISTFLLLTNILAAIKAVNSVTGEKVTERYDQANIVMGVNQSLAGLFSTVGSIPLSATAGFIIATRMKEKLPFIIGSAVLIVLSSFPVLMVFFASIPAPVGYATIFLSIANLGAVGLSQFLNVKMSMDKLVIFGLSLMLGFGAMLIPTEALTQLPVSIRTVANNGLIIGVVACIVLEQWTKKTERQTKTM